MCLYFPKLLILIAVGFLDATNIRFETPRKNYCPSADKRCIEITSCPAALTGFRTGKHPKVCGWVKEVPLVCCQEDDKDEKDPTRIQSKSNTISPISPKGCGIRSPAPQIAVTEGADDFADDPPIALEPRRVESDNDSILLATDTDLIEVFPIHFAVGGKSASQKWPWMVAIFNGNKQKQLCGGAVIDDRHVLTAAHCFAGRSLDPRLYTVQIGEIHLRDTNIYYEVQEIKMHEGYRKRYYYDDIAIIRLRDPLPNDVVSVCLPGEDFLIEGDNVTILGWGDLSFGGPSSSILQEVDGLRIVGNKACNSKFKKISGMPFPRGITQNFVCAGLEEGGKDACQWIPSHVGLSGNELADALAKEGTVADPNSDSLTFLEFCSKINKTVASSWHSPPKHEGYCGKKLGRAIAFKGSRVQQTTWSRLLSGHLKCFKYHQGDKIYPICRKCDTD